jgi:hypothetical protein
VRGAEAEAATPDGYTLWPMLRAFFAILILLPGAALACPLADQLQAGSLSRDPGDVDRLVNELKSLKGAECADAVAEAVLSHRRPDFVARTGEIVAQWPDVVAVPWLYRRWSEGWFSPGGRREDVLHAMAEQIQLRIEDGGVAHALSQHGLVDEWLTQARARYLQEWGPALTVEAPSFDAATLEDARLRWTACLSDPSVPPPDPYDPRGVVDGTAGELSRAGRCASYAILLQWSEAEAPEWQAAVKQLNRQYSQSSSAIGQMVDRLEIGWRQGETPGTGDPIASPDEPLPTSILRDVLRGFAVFALVAFLLAVPRRTRKVGFPLLAIAFGLGLIGAVEIALGLAGKRPGDTLRPIVPLPMDPTHARDGQQWFIDQRGWPVLAGDDADLVRIGVVGASSVVGPTLGEAESLSGRLRDRLSADIPCVQVINIGMHGAASPKFRSYAEEGVREFGLDGVVLYGGHNEVADTRETSRYFDLDPDRLRLRGQLTRLRLYGLLQGVLQTDTELPKLTEEQIERAKDDRNFRQYKPRFEATVTARAEREFIDLARAMERQDVPLIVALPAFNHHGLRVGLPSEGIEGVNVEALKARMEDDPKQALDLAQEAVRIAPEHPALWALLSLALEQTGDLEGAEDAIQECARRNHSGSTVTPGVVAALRAAADEHGVLVDAHAALHAASGDHLPGFDLFIDFVHLNPKAVDVVTDAIVDGARNAGLIDRWAAACPGG